MGNNGGRRPGAGRKPGSKSRVAKAAARAPVLTGQTPVAFLEAIMHDATVKAADRIDAAKALLPYVHRRLPMAIEHGGRIDTHVTIEPTYIEFPCQPPKDPPA